MIELKNTVSGYGGKRVLEGVTLAFPKGKLISLIGANGSGKSTLLKTVAGIIKADSGEIFVDGESTDTLSRRDRAKKIAYLAQGRSVPDMTVEQMVLHGRFPHLGYPRRYSEKDRRIAGDALRQMKIEPLADRPLSSLSGGMRQKAYIAMALTQDTDYILLDEPTTYLDISNQVELMHILRSLADAGKGIVAVMHDLELAFGFSDSIAVLKDGAIAACDTPESICKAGSVRDVFGVELQYAPETGLYHYGYKVR